MKIYFILLITFSVISLTSCNSCQNNKKVEDTKANTSIEEQYLSADLKIKIDSLVAEFSRMNAIPVFLDAQSGELTVTAKEKKVKPTYLLSIKESKKLTLTSQKYRALAMYRIDMGIANMYGMPLEDYKQVIARLLVDVDNVALAADINHKVESNPEEFKAYISDVYERELEKGTIDNFWNLATGGIVEQIYVISQNIEKFIVCFDDKTASEVSYRLILVHEGINNLIEYHPELKELQTIIEPLKKLNAINLEQLKSQLYELKGEIQVVRDNLLK